MSCQTLTTTTRTAARPGASIAAGARPGAMLATSARPASSGFCREYDFTPPVGGQQLVTIGDENPFVTIGGDFFVTIG